MKDYRPAKRRATVSVGESVRILRELFQRQVGGQDPVRQSGDFHRMTSSACKAPACFMA